MKTFNFKRDESDDVVLVVHDNPKEMVIDHLNDFQRHLSQAGDMGTTLDDFDARFARMDQFLELGKLDEAKVEKTNLRYGTYFFLQGINIESRAVADVVVSLNGKTYERTDEALEALGKELSATLTGQEKDEVIEHIKGKFGGR